MGARWRVVAAAAGAVALALIVPGAVSAAETTPSAISLCGTVLGGVMGGAALKAGDVEQISKWPSREEQLSILVGQILSPGAKLASQLTSAGAALASQIKQKAEGDEAAIPAAEAAT